MLETWIPLCSCARRVSRSLPKMRSLPASGKVLCMPPEVSVWLQSALPGVRASSRRTMPNAGVRWGRSTLCSMSWRTPPDGWRRVEIDTLAEGRHNLGTAMKQFTQGAARRPEECAADRSGPCRDLSDLFGRSRGRSRPLRRRAGMPGARLQARSQDAGHAQPPRLAAAGPWKGGSRRVGSGNRWRWIPPMWRAGWASGVPWKT